MTTSIALSEAKVQFSSLVRQVEIDGSRFIVERHGKPIARIVPIAGTEATDSFGALSAFACAEKRAQESSAMKQAWETKHAADR